MSDERERPSVVQVVGDVVAQLQGAGANALSQARVAQQLAVSRLTEQLERVRALLGELPPAAEAGAADGGEVAAQVDMGLRRARVALEQLGLTGALVAPIGETVSSLGQRTQWVVADQAERVARQAGRSFLDGVRPGSAADADHHAARLEARIRAKRDSMAPPAKIPVVVGAAQAEASVGPAFVSPSRSLRQGAKVASMAGLSAGAVGLGQALLHKYLQGKNVFRGELTAEDWQHVFLRAGQHGLGGAAAAVTVYSLTGLNRQGAPFAAGYVSSAQAVVALHREYRTGEIDQQTFMDMAQLACAEGAALSLAQAAGQTLIPWARLGPALGTLAGQWVTHIADAHLGGREPQLVQQIVQQVSELRKLTRLRDQPFLAQLERSFGAVGSLAEAAFDAGQNRALRRLRWSSPPPPPTKGKD